MSLGRISLPGSSFGQALLWVSAPGPRLAARLAQGGAGAGASTQTAFHTTAPSNDSNPFPQILIFRALASETTPGSDVGSPCQTQVWYVTLPHARNISSLPQSLGLTDNFPHQKGAGAGALEETLGRLSKKAGVRATIVLDRASGAILKTSGQVGSIRKTKVPASSVPAVGSFTGEANGNASTTPSQDEGAEELASMVWNFVSTAGSFVQELDTEVNSFRVGWCGSTLAARC